ncbi:hypothetical protein D9M69_693190 [compost metagenome]
MVLVEHALEGEDHVVGVELAGRLEIAGAVELHAAAQLEGPGLAVGTGFPAFGQGRHGLGAAALELHQAVEQGFRGGVVVGAGRVLARVEAGRAAFGAEHQIAGGEARRAGQQQAASDQRMHGNTTLHAHA